MSKQPLKERALGRPQVKQIAGLMSASWDKFPHDEFIAAAEVGFDSAGILQRVRIVSTALAEGLPPDFTEATDILLSALEFSSGATSLFGDFVYAPFSDAVALLGCRPSRLRRSLDVLRDMTVYFSSELALRPFLVRFAEETLGSAEEWTRDPREQVRRLASESTRPLLPWAPRVLLPFDRTIRVLEALKNDTSEFVLRSVGNHLDDVAKRDPQFAAGILSAWQSDKWRAASERIVVRHATRSLLRSGDRRVFPILGLRAEPALAVFSASLSAQTVFIGGRLRLRIAGETVEDEKLYVDMELRYPSATPGKTNMRVFKLRAFRAEAHSPFCFERLVKTSSTSTRRYRPGTCIASIRVNGTERETLEFEFAE